MRKTKKIVAIIMSVVTILSAVFVVSSFALSETSGGDKGTMTSSINTDVSGYSTSTLKSAVLTSVTSKRLYKVSVSKAGLINITANVKKSTRSGSYATAYFALLDSSKKVIRGDETWFGLSTSAETSRSISVPVSAGTYYIAVSNVTIKNGATINLIYTTTPEAQIDNFCTGHAKVLTEYERCPVYQSADCCYDRWFKFETNKNSDILFRYDGDGELVLMNENFTESEVVKKFNTNCYKICNLTAGTYYLVLERDYDCYASESILSWEYGGKG